MENIAVRQCDGERSILGQHSFQEKRYLPYACQIKSSAFNNFTREKIPQVSDGSSLRVPPRWDSLAYSSSPTAQTEPDRVSTLPLGAISAVSPTLPSPCSVEICTSRPGNDVGCTSIRTPPSLPDTMPSYSDSLSDTRNPAAQTRIWQQPVHRSISCFKAPSTSVSPYPKTKPKATKPNGYDGHVDDPPTSVSASTPLVNGYNDHLVSKNLETPSFESTLWLSELDSGYDFTSQLTASMSSSTTATDDSSILTQTGSITSLKNFYHCNAVHIMSMDEKEFAKYEYEKESQLDGTMYPGNMAEKWQWFRSLDSKSLNNSHTVLLKRPQTAIDSDFPHYRLSLPSLAPIPTSSMVISMSAMTEDPDLFDRYGFQKANRYITKEQYDAWNAEYSFYIARRRRKWIAYLKDSAMISHRPIRFPLPSIKTTRFVRKGIPPDWRGAAWFYYAGGPAVLAKHSGLYKTLLHKPARQVDVEAIERDLYRTFPDNVHFKPLTNSKRAPNVGRSVPLTMTGVSEDKSILGPQPASAHEPPIITSLRRVLHAFSNHNPRVGYFQSLNFLAGLLLLFVETEEQCFWLLNIVANTYLPETHNMDFKSCKMDLGVLMTELCDNISSMWEKISGEQEQRLIDRPGMCTSIRKSTSLLRQRKPESLPVDQPLPIVKCMAAWFRNCCIGILPIETTLRVWDVFFYEGSKTHFRIALSILKGSESEINSVRDASEMFKIMEVIPRQMLDANALLDACFTRRNGFGYTYQEAVKKRRQKTEKSRGQAATRRRGN